MRPLTLLTLRRGTVGDLEYACPRNIQAARQANACTNAGGTCVVARDGFYLVSAAGVVLGAALLLTYRRCLAHLDALPLDSWRDKSLHKS